MNIYKLFFFMAERKLKMGEIQYLTCKINDKY